MRNVRKSSDNCKIVQPTKKGLKRLKPNNNIGNSLMKKLEPTLPLLRKPTKFKSPYKSPQILKKTQNENEEPISTLSNRSLDKPAQNEVQSNANIINKNLTKLGETDVKQLDDETRCGKGLARNEKVIDATMSLPKMSSVKIQPIDPYKFCEPILKECARSSVAQKDMVFKRSKEEQVCVGNAL
ncbi:Hypothetical predicted protein [Paramuricea clavata]|uniref:Uncharacterized protein n=1 Tax=Paramuricea clavata TaxID=317549 RepID=A0A7D9DEV3_PARCT|nr:Hypothetical predicted protein [Paramuricea clavata]